MLKYSTWNWTSKGSRLHNFNDATEIGPTLQTWIIVFGQIIRRPQIAHMHFPCTVQFATVQCRYKVLKLSKLDLMPFGWLRLAAKLNNITVWWFHKPFKISLALVPFHKYHIGILHTYRSPVVFQLALVVLWQSGFSVLTISTAENLF